jgi:hypothetical protein
MIYGDEQKIWVTINNTLIKVNAATPDNSGLEWEKSSGIVRQWIYLNGDGYKYHVGTDQVIGPYDPLKPVRYLKNKCIKL